MNRTRPVAQVRKPARHGVALLIVLALLIIVSAAIGLAVRANLAARLESRRAAARLQTEFLADAGYDLAATQLRSSPGYSGEVWQIPADQLAGRDAAQVDVQVAPDPASPDARIVTVVAEYPMGESKLKHRQRLVRTWKPPVTESATP